MSRDCSDHGRVHLTGGRVYDEECVMLESPTTYEATCQREQLHYVRQDVSGHAPTCTAMSYPAKLLLIKLVKQQESIWNTRCADYTRPDLKVRAWNKIAEQMRANGFEAQVGRLKVMWKNLRDQWKRNLSSKLPPEREWYFQRRINFLADTYEGGEQAYFPRSDGPGDRSPSPADDHDDMLYNMKDDELFDFLKRNDGIEGNSSTGDAPSVLMSEPKFEVLEDGRPRGPTLVTVLEQNAAHAGVTVRKRIGDSSSYGALTTPMSALPLPKRLRTENILEAGATTAPPTKPQTNIIALAKALKTGRSIFGNSNRDHANKPVDVYDKYAAFVSTTLREMPELEAKRKMREMTLLLLEELDFNV